MITLGPQFLYIKQQSYGIPRRKKTVKKKEKRAKIQKKPSIVPYCWHLLCLFPTLLKTYAWREFLTNKTCRRAHSVSSFKKTGTVNISFIYTFYKHSPCNQTEKYVSKVKLEIRQTDSRWGSMKRKETRPLPSGLFALLLFLLFKRPEIFLLGMHLFRSSRSLKCFVWGLGRLV